MKLPKLVVCYNEDEYFQKIDSYEEIGLFIVEQKDFHELLRIQFQGIDDYNFSNFGYAFVVKETNEEISYEQWKMLAGITDRHKYMIGELTHEYEGFPKGSRWIVRKVSKELDLPLFKVHNFFVRPEFENTYYVVNYDAGEYLVNMGEYCTYCFFPKEIVNTYEIE